MADVLDCDLDPKSKSLAQAREDILKQVSPVAGIETVELLPALGRTLAVSQCANVAVPSYPSSAMDGFAIGYADLEALADESGAVTLPVVGTNLAGLPSVSRLVPSSAVRIMTGAFLPDGADTVIMQEHVELQSEGQRMRLIAVVIDGIQQGQHCRPVGEDISAGQTIVNAGTILQAAHLGVLATQGLAAVNVRRRLRVGLFVSGDELQSAGEPLAAGQIYDSNRVTVAAMLTSLGCEVVDMGRVEDSLAVIENTLQQAAAAELDAVITTGGVSVGEADYIRDAVANVGRLQLWRVAIKPGRPFAYGQLDKAGTEDAGICHFFGLPGNPVSAMVTFYLLVQPALQKLAGQQSRAFEEQLIEATTTERLRKRVGRMDFQRGQLSQGKVSSIGAQGSGRLSSMAVANCLIALEADRGDVDAGERVNVLPFYGLV